MLILRRNWWLVLATAIMVLFALALTFAGSAPTGTLGVDMLTVSVSSMTTLAVYLAPLLALMIAFDTIAGERDRGTLGLLLAYPAGRGEILIGKFLAHLAALGIATTIGLGSAGVVAALAGGAGGVRRQIGVGPPSVAASVAKLAEQLSVHVDEVSRPGAFMQIVDILRD